MLNGESGEIKGRLESTGKGERSDGTISPSFYRKRSPRATFHLSSLSYRDGIYADTVNREGSVSW